MSSFQMVMAVIFFSTTYLKTGPEFFLLSCIILYKRKMFYGSFHLKWSGLMDHFKWNKYVKFCKWSGIRMSDSS